MKKLITLCSVAAWAFLIGNVLSGDAGVPRSNANATTTPKFEFVPAPPEVSRMLLPMHAPLNYVPKKPGHYSPQDWRAAIDATWGPGLDPGSSMLVWSYWWDLIDAYYAAFNGLSSNVWDSVHAVYNPEMADFGHPVSKGRLAAILDHSALALKDAHSRAKDSTVETTMPAPGVPIQNVLWHGEQSFFGAGLTPLPDSTALVYQAVPNHLLGLVAGDVVLGYDRTPWMQLYRELIAAELPIRGIWGTSDASIAHFAIMSAGMNWHLFDTIDVVKYATGDTVHLPTSLMVGTNTPIWATEQLDIPGIPKPNYYDSQLVTWGIIPGTQIGYIYANGWFWNAGAEWYNAIDSLINHTQTTGIVIDSRMNMGATLGVADAGMSLLFDDTVETFRWHRRCNTSDHFAMCRPYWSWYNDSVFTIFGRGGYHKPIAILLGPASISGGDFHPAQAAYHPMAKVFGKPSSGAFGFRSSNPGIGYPGFYTWYTPADSYVYNKPSVYLTRKGFPDPQFFPEVPYQDVWLTKDGVAQGRDDVVEAAKAWILSRDLDQDGVVNENDNCPEVYNPLQEDADQDGRGDSCCCLALTGNVDGDAGDITDISDLSVMVDYLFFGGAISLCGKENDLDSSGSVDISDLSVLVDFLFFGGSLPSCP